MVSVEVDGAKIWLPSVIAVEQGDKVKLTLKNLVPGADNKHGFSIPAYNVTEVVTRDEPKTITFVADKAGTFPFLANGRARALGDTTGMVKVIADATTDEILGVHMVGPGVSELIAEAVVAMEFKAASEDIARICHAHPSLSEATKEASLAVDKRALNY